MQLSYFLIIISGAGIASAHTTIHSADSRHEATNFTISENRPSESSIIKSERRAEVISMIPQPKIAKNNTYHQPIPNEKGGGHGDGGGDGGDGSGNSGGSGSGSGSGGKGGRGGDTSAARNLLAPKKVVVAVVFAITVRQNFGFLPMALLTLPILAQARAIQDSSIIGIPSNSINTSLSNMDVDQKGGYGRSRGGGGGYITTSSSAREQLVCSRVFVGTALAVLAQQSFLSLPLTLLAFAAIVRAEIPIPPTERSTALETVPTATAIVQYDISGIPYTIVMNDKSDLTTSVVGDASTESPSATIFSTATTTMPIASKLPSSTTTSSTIPSRVAGSASGIRASRCCYGFAALGMGLLCSFLCHYV